MPIYKFKVLVCGGRDYDRADAFNWLECNAKDAIAHLFEVPGNIEIATLVHGGASGADQGGAAYGASEHANVIEYKADWRKHGKAAGPIRNKLMLVEQKPDIVFAFPGGRGTKNMIEQAEEYGIPVVHTGGSA